MTHGISRAGLGIALEYPWRSEPQDWIVNPGALGEMGRVLFHETLHVWQVLSQAFQTNLALLESVHAMRYMDAGQYITLEEGQRLLGINESAEQRSVEDELERLDLTAVDPLGFSPHDLYESVARYWDIVVVGADSVYQGITGEALPADWTVQSPNQPAGSPTLDAIHHVMTLREDAYSLPYVIADEMYPSLGALLFPLVAHCALQTRQPVQVFSRAMEWLYTHRPASPPKISGVTEFHQYMWPVVQQACYDASLEVGETGLVPAMSVIDESQLAENPVYQHYRFMYAHAVQLHGEQRMSELFAIPAAARKGLWELFPPPLIEMEGGRWTGGTWVQHQALNLVPFSREGRLVRLSAGPHTPEFRDYVLNDTPQAYIERIADHSERFVAAWRAMRLQRLVRRKTESLNLASGH